MSLLKNTTSARDSGLDPTFYPSPLTLDKWRTVANTSQLLRTPSGRQQEAPGDSGTPILLLEEICPATCANVSSGTETPYYDIFKPLYL